MRDAESWDVPLISFGYIPTLTTHRIPPTKYSLQAPHRSVQGAAVNPNVEMHRTVHLVVSGSLLRGWYRNQTVRLCNLFLQLLGVSDYIMYVHVN